MQDLEINSIVNSLLETFILKSKKEIVTLIAMIFL
jgi:hypothetical protein